MLTFKYLWYVYKEIALKEFVEVTVLVRFELTLNWFISLFCPATILNKNNEKSAVILIQNNNLF